MRKMPLLLVAATMSICMRASAGECRRTRRPLRLGGVHGKKEKTDGSVQQMSADGETYCFSNEPVKWNVMADLEDNPAKAKEAFKK